MAAVFFSPLGNGYQFLNQTATEPLNGGLLYTYEANTTTPLATYTTINGDVANTNPIVIDIYGRAPEEIWLIQFQTYDFALYDSLGNLIRTYPDISGILANLHGIPAGGTINQVLTKLSATDYDVDWEAIQGLMPAGGTAGQVLTKNSATDYDTIWSTPSTQTGDHKVMVTTNDTTPNYLSSKLVDGPDITFQVNNPGANETYSPVITFPSTLGTIGAYVTFSTEVGLAISSQFNLDPGTPITEDGTDIFTIYFDTPFVSTGYTVVGTFKIVTTTESGSIFVTASPGRATSSCQIQFISSDPGVIHAEVNILFFGAQ